jgi:GH15 family glucan-1,4-alpha-glucosidase
MSPKIEDYAVIGDCETAALVGRDGSIDWLCWPRFDSDACFAALLGKPEHGRWLIAPARGGAHASRRYRGDTLILETDFECEEGTVTLIDFMPIRGQASDVVRIVVGKRGNVAMRFELILRFGYGTLIPWVTRLDDGTLRGIVGPDMVVLRSPAALRGEDLKTVGEFTVREGEVLPFVLTYGPSHLPVPEPIDAGQALQETEAFWQSWVEGASDAGEWAPAVRRSLVTLKALTYRPTGGMVAAPTTSLPEWPGGPRNWDYRFCWLRDATFTLLALMNGGYLDEAKAWIDWLLRTTAGSPPQIQIMYGLAGERRLSEWEVPWLPGFAQSGPVRIGNAAAQQFQLDVFGEVMDALYQARLHGLDGEKVSWAFALALMEHLESIWQEPDKGIWEVRGPPQHFTYSKVMAWVAFDRAVKSCVQFGLDGPVERWKAIAAKIHEEVCANAFNPEIGAFVQAYGSSLLDASVLLMGLVGFLPCSDPRLASTVDVIQRDLTHDGLVLRYSTEKTEDGLPPGEGVFLACSFWLADNLVLLRRNAEARTLFKRLLSLRNDVGLLAEEYDPRSRRLLGNFPQAFSHVALVNTAYNLAHRHKPAQQRSGHPAKS